MMIYDDVDDDGDDHDALLVMIMMPCWTNGCIVYTDIQPVVIVA